MKHQDLNDAQAASFFRPIPMAYMPEGVRVLEGIPYGGHVQQRMVDLPRTPAPAPMLIEFHGGGWRFGDKQQLGVYRGMIEAVLETGVAVVAANYRLTPESPWPAQVQDAARVVQFARHKAAEWGVDPKRVVLAGGSAGGHLAVWIAAHADFADPASADQTVRESTRVSGAMDCWGPMDLTRERKLEGRAEAIYTQLFQCAKEDWDSPRVMALRREASPVNLVSSHTPPILIVHDRPLQPLPDGSGWVEDGGHPASWGAVLEARLKEAGVAVTALYGATPETWNPAAVAFLRERFGL